MTKKTFTLKELEILKKWDKEITDRFFEITSIHRDDLTVNGFDASKVTDEQMTVLAGNMAEMYCDHCFHSDLILLAGEMGIPLLKETPQEECR